MENKKSKRVNWITLIICVSIIFVVVVVNFVMSYLTKKHYEEIENTTSNSGENIVEDVISIVPKLYITGDILTLENKSQIAKVSCKYLIEEENNFAAYATVKLQGTSSLAYDKKNYTITFFSDEECNNKLKIDFNYGWGAQNKYCFKANWIDSTQARNVVSARIASQMQEKYNLFMDTPNNGLIDGYPVEIYLNDEFLGLYTCNIPKDAWMFNMNKENENHIVMCSESNLIDTPASFSREAEAIDGEYWSIEVGPNETQEDIDNTFEKFNRLISFIKDSSDEEFKEHFSEHLDLDSCLNYLAFIWLNNCTDNISKNMLLVTYDGNVWYPSLYDLDSTFGLYYNGSKTCPPDTIFPEQYEASKNLLWERILICYSKEFKQRYNELRKTILSNENMIYEFKKFESSIPEEVWVREHTRWNYIPSINFGIDQIINFIEQRSEYVDKVINEL